MAENRTGPRGATNPEKKGKASALLRQSASVILLSPTNQVLLVHRVQTSSAFPSAHVFPGGMVSPDQDGDVPPGTHRDSPACRLAAVRETFEESGILLARRAGPPSASPNGPSKLLHVPDAVREEARKQIHGNQLRFGTWLRGLAGAPDTERLVPFTRWITPPPVSKRFSTQMYIYMLPQSSSADGPLTSSVSPAAEVAPGAPAKETAVPLPTSDGGVEHTAAEFADAADWLARQRAGKIILYPPQLYLLSILSQLLTGPPAAGASRSERDHYASQRDALLRFISTTPTSSVPGAGHEHPTALIPWTDKVICPYVLQARREEDGRTVLGLDKPGPELKGSGRGGDGSRVVLLRFDKKVPRDVEVKQRAEVMGEESAHVKGKL